MVVCPLCKIEIADRTYHDKICMNKITIEIRQDCKECGKDIVDARYRTFCGKKCRIRWHNRNRKGYLAEWKKAKKEKLLTAT